MNEEYLPLVAEEAAEVIQECMKIMRFGLTLEKKANLELEIGDLFEVISRLKLDAHLIARGRINKSIKLQEYGPQ